MEKRNPYLINKAFNSFLVASLLTVAATQVGATVDGMMLSYLIGEQAMGSVNICRPVMQQLFSLCMLLGAGSSMLVGVAIGNRNRAEADRIFTAVMTLVAIIGVGALAAGLVGLRPLVAFLCPDVQLQGVTAEYLGVTLYGAVFYMLSVISEMFVAVDGNPKRVTTAVMSCAMTNITLDYVFIAVLHWGVTGAAWATVISYIVSVALLLPHFRHPGTLRLRFKECAKTLVPSLSTGLPFGIATTLMAVQMWGTNNIAMTHLGQGGIIALSVCIYLLCLSMIILTGTLKTFQPVASILKGANDGHGVLMVIRKAYAFMSASLLLFALPLVLCPRWVAMAFGISELEALNIATQAIPAYSLNIILQCVVYLLIPIYQLYGNKALATFISVGQPLAPLLGMWLLAEVAPRYVWWGFAMGQAAVALLTALFAWTRRRHDHSLMPLVLVPRGEATIGVETSIPAQIGDMGRLVDELDSFLKAHMTDPSLVMHIEVCAEELLKNIITHGYARKGNKHYIDYRLSITPGKVCMVISDDAMAFNPVEYDKQTGIGLLLVRGLCTEIKYDYLFRQNITTVAFACDA